MGAGQREMNGKRPRQGGIESTNQGTCDDQGGQGLGLNSSWECHWVSVWCVDKEGRKGAEDTLKSVNICETTRPGVSRLSSTCQMGQHRPAMSSNYQRTSPRPHSFPAHGRLITFSLKVVRILSSSVWIGVLCVGPICSGIPEPAKC